MTLQLVRQFIACKGNALAAKRLYRSLALAFHPDKGGGLLHSEHPAPRL